MGDDDWASWSHRTRGHRHDQAQQRREGKIARLERELGCAQSSADYYRKYCNSLMDTHNRENQAKEEKLLEKETVIALKDDLISKIQAANVAYEKFRGNVAQEFRQQEHKLALTQRVVEGQRVQLDHNDKEIWALKSELFSCREDLLNKDEQIRVLEHERAGFRSIIAELEQADFFFGSVR